MDSNRVKELQAIASQSGMRFGSGQSSSQTQKKKGNFFTDLIPTATSILGGIGGSFLAPGIGTAGGGVAGGLLGTKLRNMLTGQEDNAGDYLQEGAFGALGGIGKGLKAIGGAGKAIATGGGLENAANILRNGAQGASAAPGLIAKLGGGLENTGSNLMASQVGVGKKAAREILGGTPSSEVFSNLNQRTGLSKLDDLLKVGSNVTGENGVLSELTRNAIGNSKGVDIGNLRRVANDLLVNKGSLLPDYARNGIIDNVKNSTLKAYEGSQGSLNPLANPLTTFDVMRDFEKQADFLKSKATMSPEAAQASDIYKNLARTIETPLYASPGVSEGLSIAKGDTLKKLQSMAQATTGKESRAYENLAKELQGTTRVRDLRSNQANFVKLRKLAKESAQSEMGSGQRLGGELQGLGKAIQRPTNLVALPLDAASPWVGNKLAQFGRGLQGVNNGNAFLPATISRSIKMGATQLPVRALSGEYSVGASAASPPSDATSILGSDAMGNSAETSTDPTAAMQVLAGLSGQGENNPASQYTMDNVIKDIQGDMQRTGGQNMDKYMKLFQFLNPKPAKKTSEFGKVSAQQHGLAKSGTEALATLSQMLDQSPDILNKTAIPGQDLPLIGGLISNLAGTGEYQATSSNVLDALARARTGAAMTSQEEAFYKRLLPRAGDSEGTKQRKLSQLYQDFQPFMGSQNNQGTSAEDILALLGAQQ